MDTIDIQSRAVALDIYKTISHSSRNDKFEENRKARFIDSAAPLIAAALRQAAADARQAEREEYETIRGGMEAMDAAFGNYHSVECDVAHDAGASKCICFHARWAGH